MPAGLSPDQHLAELNDGLWKEVIKCVLRDRDKIERVTDALLAKIDGSEITYKLAKDEIANL